MEYVEVVLEKSVLFAAGQFSGELNSVNSPVRNLSEQINTQKYIMYVYINTTIRTPKSIHFVEPNFVHCLFK
jgi:hypothetical protein